MLTFTIPSIFQSKAKAASTFSAAFVIPTYVPVLQTLIFTHGLRL